MSNDTLWQEYEKLEQQCKECGGTAITITDLFNFFSSDQLEEFLEFIKEERANQSKLPEKAVVQK